MSTLCSGQDDDPFHPVAYQVRLPGDTHLLSDKDEPRCASEKEVNHSVVRVSCPPRDLLYRIRGQHRRTYNQRERARNEENRHTGSSHLSRE